MESETQVLFMAVGAVVLIGVVVLLCQVDWRSLSEAWTGNNDSRAKVYVRYGIQRKVYDGRLLHRHPLGATYEYRAGGGILWTLFGWGGKVYEVTLPPSYPVEWIGGARVVLVNAGELVAAPFEGYRGNGVPEVNVSELVRSRLGVEVIHSLFGGSTTNVLLWAAVALVIGAGLVFGIARTNPGWLGLGESGAVGSSSGQEGPGDKVPSGFVPVETVIPEEAVEPDVTVPPVTTGKGGR